MRPITLRPYQQKFIDDVRNEFHNNKRVVGVAPCGAGKTIMTGWMTREATERGKRTIFFVHRHELIEQTSETFKDLGIEHGIISAGYPMQLDLPVQIASVQTLARRIDKIPTPDFLICDECHHILANTYKIILDAFPKAYLLGVTATPLRMGGVTLCDVFTSMVESLTVNELIQLGNLTKFEYFVAEEDLDLSAVKSTHGDFNTKDLEKVMIDQRITGDIVGHYRKYSSGNSAICYCVNVNHSITVAKAFNDAGIPAEHVDADTPKDSRAYIVNQFRRGNIKILCNAELFGEGFDVPNCQTVILARPTQSLTLYIQQSMRSMRPDPNDLDKVAVIIDHVQNYKRHGLPNKVHLWTLEPYEKGKLFCDNFKKYVKPNTKDMSWIETWHIRGKQSQIHVKVSSKSKFCPQCRTLLQTVTCPQCGDDVIRHVVEVKHIIGFDAIQDCDVIENKNRKNLGDVASIGGVDLLKTIQAGDSGLKLDFCPHCQKILGVITSEGAPAREVTYREGGLVKVPVNYSTDPKSTASHIKHKPTTVEEFNIVAKNRGYKLNRKGVSHWAVEQALEYATSYKDCLHIAKFAGYKKGWAWHQWQDIQAHADNKNCASAVDGARCLG